MCKDNGIYCCFPHHLHDNELTYLLHLQLIYVDMHRFQLSLSLSFYLSLYIYTLIVNCSWMEIWIPVAVSAVVNSGLESLLFDIECDLQTGKMFDFVDATYTLTVPTDELRSYPIRPKSNQTSTRKWPDRTGSGVGMTNWEFRKINMIRDRWIQFQPLILAAWSIEVPTSFL